MGRPARSRLATLGAILALLAGGLGSPRVADAATTLTFQPVADAQTYSSHPTTNYGTLTSLRTREGAGTSTDPTYRSYLRFDVSGISGQVTGVTLRLSATDPSPNSQGVYAVAAGWTETGIAYGNAPANGTPLGAAPVPNTGYNDIALDPSSVPGDGSVWLGMVSAGTNSAIFDSREGAAPPLLVVTLGGAPVKPVAGFSGTPRSGNAQLAVAFTDASTNGPTGWSWDFGDPTSGAQNTSSLRNPSHTYANPGTYDVSLIASNTAGPSDPLVKIGYITVSTPPPPGDAVLVGAGDIADCSRTQDSKTEALLASIPGTVFAAGDLTYPNGTTAEFANCYGPTWGLEKARTRPIVGNHEYNTSGAAPYYAYWGAAAGDPSKGYYSYDIGGWHAVVLNSNCSKVGGCGAGSAQEKWLKADLAASTAACTIAFWHHARFSSSRTSPDNVTLALWQDLYAAGAEIAVSGHYHNYERFAPQAPDGTADPATGIRQFVVGTGGTGLGGFKSTIMANSQVHERSTYGVLKLTLHASSYDFQFIPIAGQTFTDSGSASCHGRP